MKADRELIKKKEYKNRKTKKTKKKKKKRCKQVMRRPEERNTMEKKKECY